MRPAEASGPQGVRAERGDASTDSLQRKKMLRVLIACHVSRKHFAAQNSRGRQDAMGLAHMNFRNCTKTECGRLCGNRSSTAASATSEPTARLRGVPRQGPGGTCMAGTWRDVRAPRTWSSRKLRPYEGSQQANPARRFSSRGAFAAPAHSVAAQPWRGEGSCANGSSRRTRLPLKPTGAATKAAPAFASTTQIRLSLTASVTRHPHPPRCSSSDARSDR